MWSGNGKRDRPPGYDDSWCLCGEFVYSSAVACLCGLPTGRYCKGDWICGDCKYSNFAKNIKKFGRQCKTCGADVARGFHAFGDDTTNAARQQKILVPCFPEASRPGPIASPLFQEDVPRNASILAPLTG